jgi:integrase
MKKIYINFWLNKSKADNPENVPIYCRVTVSDDKVPGDTDRKEISTGKCIDPARWEYKVHKNGKDQIVNDQKVIGNKSDAIIINKHLDKMKLELLDIFDELKRRKEFISAALVKSVYTGTTDSVHTLIRVYEAEVNRKRELASKGELTDTYIKQLESKINNLKSFLFDHYKKQDVYLHEVDYSFIKSFEHWGKTKTEIKEGTEKVKRQVWVHNTAMDNLKRLKEVTDECVKNSWLTKDPFLGHDIGFDPPKFKFLEESEIEKIESTDFKSQRLNEVRDVFIFCCYTGLAYADVFALTDDFITITKEGIKCILKERQKTDEPAYIPLLDKPKLILDKYVGHPTCLMTGKLLPVLSNQKYNAYLKKIAEEAGIKKKLTTHVARHSAATYLLSNDVPEETTAEVLGLSVKELRRTYGKLIKKKVVKDIQNLQKKINDSKTG